MRRFLLLAILMALTMSISAQNDDPHASGYWAVIIDKNNQEVWYKLDSDIINNPEMRTCFVVADTTLADYQNWQGNYPKIPFYFVVDGKHYGGAEDMAEVNYEDPTDNPLFENDNHFFIYADNYYYLGIFTNPETQQQYCYVAQCMIGFGITETPVITYDITDDEAIITATGAGDVRLFLDDKLVENPYTLLRGDEDQTYIFTAQAKRLCERPSEPAMLEITVPARDTTHDTGYWAVIIDKNNQEVWYKLDSDIFNNPEMRTCFVVADTTLADYQNWQGNYPKIPFYFVVDGKHYGGAEDMAEVNYEDPTDNPLFENDNHFFIYADNYYYLGIFTNPETQQQYCYVAQCMIGFGITETPVITYDITDDEAIITATGAGDVRLFLDDKLVENPYTLLRGDEDQTYIFTAQAKRLCERPSEPAMLEITVPARDTTHDTGYWVVLIDKNGNEVWEKLTRQEDSSYRVIVAVDYGTYGGHYNHETGEVGDACFNFSIDGFRYGPENNLEPVTLKNVIPLFIGNNYYNVPIGKYYAFTISQLDDEEWIAWIETASDVDEIGVDGKVVSSVRYYNIMGQEMREANGLTIIVTTYTDGSYDAVKVIK